MIFHLIWIKEKNQEQYEINFLLEWWDEDFIRDFLTQRWVVVVSLEEYKDDPEKFWNITMSVLYDNREIKIIMQWDDLEERIYFVAYLWLSMQVANFIDNPIPEFQMKDLIESVFLRIKKENEKIKEEKEETQVKEQKKFEEQSIHEWLKVINENIDRVNQTLKAWEWILSLSEINNLEECSNEMKKIRLWTNFNKMMSLVLEAHTLVSKAEEKIFKTYENEKFLIGKNSVVNNVDVLSEVFNSNKALEKATFTTALTTTESFYKIAWPVMVYLQLLKKDLADTFSKTTFPEFFSVTINLVEYILLTTIIVISALYTFARLLWINEFSLKLLPALWRWWLLIYLLNTLNFKSTMFQIVWFIVLAILYWVGLQLLLWTFAL